MSLISGTAAYENPYYYSTANGTAANTGLTAAGGAKTETDTSQESSADPVPDVRVTLSGEVALARTRDAMGLPPTGPLKMGDFKDAADAREKEVTERLKTAVQTLGISEEQTISLSLDQDSKITISETFPGKEELEAALNEDADFEKAFKQLSANQQILDFTDTLKSEQTSLADFMDSSSDWDSIMSLAAKSRELKAMGNSMSALLHVSREETPYTMTFDPSAEEKEPT